MKLNEFVEQTFKQKHKPYSDFVLRPKIVCVDGFTMSVQGSSGHYCAPRSTQNAYYEMEIGYPSLKEDDLMPYAEDADSPTNAVYGYVPCEIIQQVIDKHGGIDIEKTLNISPAPAQSGEV